MRCYLNLYLFNWPKWRKHAPDGVILAIYLNVVCVHLAFTSNIDLGHGVAVIFVIRGTPKIPSIDTEINRER